MFTHQHPGTQLVRQLGGGHQEAAAQESEQVLCKSSAPCVARAFREAQKLVHALAAGVNSKL